ncbi:MAG TPA: MFS transporter [Acetobacteraceae bacterium]|jgi:sugar phosphate permease
MTGGAAIQTLPRTLSRRLPFFYGWVILACTCCAGFSRQGGAVATLSIFVEPMTREFGWTRTALSGAVSLGGVLAALSAPLHGRALDRHGARFLLCAAILTTGAAAMLLSLTNSLIMFYLLFCIARMNFAAPFDLGIYGAVTNWFIARRPLATAIATLAQMAGLIALPMIAQLGILHGGWRTGWLAIGIAVIAVGFVPNWLLMVRAPEDLGLLPDAGTIKRRGRITNAETPEPTFTRAQALRTPAFWLLSLFTLLAFPVQAGVSLHQAPYLIERGIDATIAATIVSTFSFMSGVSSLAFGALARSFPIRYALALSGLLQGAGALAMLRIALPLDGYVAAAIFGAGVGGLMTLLPIAWADYFGRRSFGAIRGVSLSIQVLGQACGPVLSGVLRDRTGSYVASLECFVVLSGLSVLAVLWARQPRAPVSRVA